MLQALPLYEELAKTSPNEMVYQDHLALCLNASAAAQADNPAEHRKAALRSQEAAKRAVALGDTSYIVQTIATRDLNAPDTPAPASPGQALMREAEKYFAAGDYAAALTKYTQAADVDPKLYEAPLFAGDAALKLKDNAAAAKWYERAVAINPNRETGYRYWGDAILAVTLVGDPDGPDRKARTKMLDPLAKAKYLDAIVAEPYKPISW
jgi:tetratricopeptide (TPR) repeat protein